MPVTRKPDGWYWGSKGPFSTKQKAVQVGQAAHASGFKESQMNIDAIAEFVSVLFNSATVAHYKHLQVNGPGADAAHRALGDYYEKIPDLVDTVVEGIQGAYDILIERYPPMMVANNDEPLEYIQQLRQYVKDCRTDLPQDSEIQNDVDAIASLLNKTCYRLKNLK
jgi:DNA-binding ferritin-like protein